MSDAGFGGARFWLVQLDDERNEIPLDLELARISPIYRTAQQPDLVTGDAEFDRAFHASGRPESMAALPRETRETLTALQHSGDITLAGGRLQWKPHSTRCSPARLARATRRLIDAAKGLRLPVGRACERLAQMSRHDTRPVRYRSLEALLSVPGGEDVARAAVRDALQDRLYPELMFLAARAIDDARARDIARQILLHPDLPRDLTIDHCRWAFSDMPPVTASTILGRILKRRDVPEFLRIACVEEVGRLQLRDLVSPLLKLTASAESALLRALAATLGELGDPRAERVLLDRLQASEPETRAAVIRALGRVGSSASVEPLLPLRGGMRVPATVRHAANEAIAAIQSRLGNVSAGSLSLSPEESGQLSVYDADAAEGGVSLPPPTEQSP